MTREAPRAVIGMPTLCNDITNNLKINILQSWKTMECLFLVQRAARFTREHLEAKVMILAGEVKHTGL